MASEPKLLHYADAKTIFRQGDAADEMYVIRSGKVRIYREQDGRETTLATLKPGDFFGEMALFTASRRSATAETMGETVLEPMDKAAFEQLVSGPLVWTMLMKMSARIREVDEELEKLSVENAVRRDHMSNLSIRRSFFA